MVKLLQEAGENPDRYLSDDAKELLEDEKIKQQLHDKYRKKI
jgi:hypothetical protein